MSGLSGGVPQSEPNQLASSIDVNDLPVEMYGARQLLHTLRGSLPPAHDRKREETWVALFKALSTELNLGLQANQAHEANRRKLEESNVQLQNKVTELEQELARLKPAQQTQVFVELANSNAEMQRDKERLLAYHAKLLQTLHLCQQQLAEAMRKNKQNAEEVHQSLFVIMQQLGQPVSAPSSAAAGGHAHGGASNGADGYAAGAAAGGHGLQP